MCVQLRVKNDVRNYLDRSSMCGRKEHFTRIAQLQPWSTADVRGGKIPRAREKFQSGRRVVYGVWYAF